MTGRLRPQIDSITVHANSGGDPNGTLFCFEGELYRGIPATRADLYRDLFHRGVIQQLIEANLLVETAIADLQVDGYPLVLKHRTIPFVSYPYEWCGTMLKDAALNILTLQRKLLDEGLCLQDAHPWNVLFDGPDPRFVDFGSIVPALPHEGWGAYQESGGSLSTP